ncbi:unnamed protein product [Periconia digitata]|uniref:Celp0028 effector like protein n=1 Tax=Periconia digitata TaxID=1303443 RepID=A0A9W4XXE4_9PLEO|nr:unnamed protein product [Periconia digitata]
MYTNYLLNILAVSSLTIAAPAVGKEDSIQTFQQLRQRGSSSSTANPVKIGLEDVVLYSRDGRYQLMKRDDLETIQELRRNKTAPPKPCSLETNLFRGPAPAASPPAQARSAPLQARADGSVKLIVPNPPSRFLGWDVQMSSVIKGAPTTLTVSSGYEISNTIGVEASTEFSIVKDFLSASLSISYEQSWTSSQSQQFEAEVPEGKFGVFVSNPWTDRNSGVVFEGRIGEEGTTSAYQADSFTAKGFSGLEWVDGVISLCTGDSLPLARCVGEGTF